MIGIVLCGGQSTRMGSDKGLIKEDNLTWAETAVSKLIFLEAPVIVSVNKRQIEAYARVFPVDMLVVDDASISVRGPLLGLLSVHRVWPGNDLLVLACDMIEMKPLLLKRLVDSYKEHEFDAYIYKTNELQPLCGVYTSAALKSIYREYMEDSLERFSLISVLEKINTKYIPVELQFHSCFNNYNSQKDLITK